MRLRKTSAHVLAALLLLVPARAGIESITAITEDILCVEWRDGKAHAATLGSGIDGRIEPEKKQLDVDLAGRADTWTLADGSPIAVLGRKSKGTDFARVAEWEIEVSKTHWIYLRLSTPLEGSTTISAAKMGVSAPVKTAPTPVLQVNQVGYLPAMPKYIYASHWMGSAGGLDLAPYADRGFQVLDAEGKVVLRGKPELRWAKDKPEGAGGMNLQRCDLWQCDVSALTKPGRYVLEWVGVGKSREFVVREDVYESAYRTLMAGLFHQRCGCALEKAHTKWPRAACHTGEVTFSNHRFTDGSNAFEELSNKATPTKRPLTGGYHDAGDWDRHTGHLAIADALLFVFDAQPERFRDGELSIPEAGNRVPDIVDEARWGVDFFLQLQGEDGGVRGGVETAGHPNFGEASWTDSLPMFAYAPDRQASYRFAATSASLARAYATLKMDGLSDRYLDAAERAWTWAEADTEGGAFPDEKMHAATSLFAATGGSAYHDTFKKLLKVRSPRSNLEAYEEFDQRWACWIYMSCERPEADEGAQKVLRRAAAHYAGWLSIDSASQRGRRQGYNWWKPFGHGALTVPDNLALIAAHRATGANKYLEQMALNLDAPFGANALGICWVTGLGENPVRDVLHIDSWYDGIDDPVPGIVPYGPRRWEDEPGWTHGFGMGSLWAGEEEWPGEELWTGNFMSPAAAEFTVWETTGPAAAALAYLWAVSRAAGQ